MRMHLSTSPQRSAGRVRAAVLALTLGLLAATAGTAAADPEPAEAIDIRPILGLSRWDFAAGDAMGWARDQLLNPSNFGVGGVVEREVVIHPPVGAWELDAGDLVGMDIVVATLVAPDAWTPASAAALETWVRQGGALLATEENGDQAFLATHFGLGAPTDRFFSPISATESVVGTVVAPGTHPVVAGPFGTTTTFRQYANVTYYTSLGDDAVQLAVNDAYRWPISCPACPLDPASGAPGTSIAAINPNKLEAGSGPVVFVSDTDTFTQAYSEPGTGTIVGGAVGNPELWPNTIAWLADPDLADADGDGIPDIDDTNAAAPTGLTAPTDPEVPEGSQATASGAFDDSDGADTLAISGSGDGSVTDNSDGTWSWAHTPTDDGSGLVTVQADDGEHAAAQQQFTWTATNVAPTVTAAAFTTTTGACVTATAPSNATLSGAFTDPGADTWIVDVDWDYDGTTFAPDGTADVTGQTFSASAAYTTPGPHTAAVRVTDDDLGVSDVFAATNTFSVAHHMSGILAPFNADGSSVWKHGSTAPVKVRITDCNGDPVPGLAPQVGTQLLSNGTPSGTVGEATSTSGADSGSTMRYDEAAGIYLFNFATKRLADAAATYRIIVNQPGVIGRDGHGDPLADQSWQTFAVKKK